MCSLLVPHQANRAHTYLGLREKEFHVTGDLKDIFPDFVMMAASFGIPAKRVTKPADLRAAIRCEASVLPESAYVPLQACSSTRALSSYHALLLFHAA